MKNIHNSHEPPDFSLVLGGPLFQLLMRLRLTTPALESVEKTNHLLHPIRLAASPDLLFNRRQSLGRCENAFLI